MDGERNVDFSDMVMSEGRWGAMPDTSSIGSCARECTAYGPICGIQEITKLCSLLAAGACDLVS